MYVCSFHARNFLLPTQTSNAVLWSPDDSSPKMLRVILREGKAVHAGKNHRIHLHSNTILSYISQRNYIHAA